MKATLRLDLNNAEFGDEPNGDAIARTLCALAARLREEHFDERFSSSRMPVFDTNGNRIGDFEVTR